jgi:hypothetical protein
MAWCLVKQRDTLSFTLPYLQQIPVKTNEIFKITKKALGAYVVPLVFKVWHTYRGGPYRTFVFFEVNVSRESRKASSLVKFL